MAADLAVALRRRGDALLPDGRRKPRHEPLLQHLVRPLAELDGAPVPLYAPCFAPAES